MIQIVVSRSLHPPASQ